MAIRILVVLTLLCHFANADNCDCSTIDFLKDVLQSEIMERKILTAKVGKLETEVKVGNAKSAADEVIEVMQQNEIQASEISRQQIAQVKAALTNAWAVHKKETLDLKKEIENHMFQNENNFQVLKKKVMEELKNMSGKSQRVFEEIYGKMREYDDDKKESLKAVHATISDIQRNTTVFSDRMKDVTLQLEKRLTDVQNKHQMYQNQADSSVRDLRGKTDRVISELQKKNKPSVYKCHHWTPSDKRYIYTEYSILKEKVRCEIYPNQVFTHGVNDFVPGCEEDCWCCRRVDN